MSRFITLGFVGLLAVTLWAVVPQAAPKAESVTVIRSTAEEIKPGTVLKEGERITLAEGEELEVLSIKGVRSSIEGPYDGPLRIEGSKVTQTRMEALRDAITGRGRGTKVLGATRDAPRPPESEEGGEETADDPEDDIEGPAILIDISTSGTWCSVEDVPLYLAREGFGRVVGTLSDTKTGVSVSLRWNHFRQAVLWPKEVKVRDGGVYEVALEGGEPVSLTLRDFEPSDEPAGDLARLAELGCSVQVNRIINELED